MADFVRLYLVSLLIFLGIDAVWLSVVAKNFYSQHIGHLMSNQPNLIAALIFYLINIVGIVVLVLMPALKDQSLSRVITYAIIYGLCTYATYDLTNYATLKNWPVIVVIVDLAWGITLTTLVSVLTFLVVRGKTH